MSDTSEKEVVYKLGDSTIAMVRELLQVAILTGTNIIDHLRAVRVRVDGVEVVPTDEYIESYNEMITELRKQAEAAQAEAQQRLADDSE